MQAEGHLFLEEVMFVRHAEHETVVAVVGIVAEPRHDLSAADEHLGEVGRDATHRDDLALVRVEVMALDGPETGIEGEVAKAVLVMATQAMEASRGRGVGRDVEIVGRPIDGHLVLGIGPVERSVRALGYGKRVAHVRRLARNRHLEQHAQRRRHVVLARRGNAALKVERVREAKRELLLVEPARGAAIGTRRGKPGAIVVVHELVDDLVCLERVCDVLALDLAHGGTADELVGLGFAPSHVLIGKVLGDAPGGGVVSAFGQRFHHVHELVDVDEAEVRADLVTHPGKAVEAIGTADHGLGAVKARGKEDVGGAHGLLGAYVEHLALELVPVKREDDIGSAAYRGREEELAEHLEGIGRDGLARAQREFLNDGVGAKGGADEIEVRHVIVGEHLVEPLLLDVPVVRGLHDDGFEDVEALVVFQVELDGLLEAIVDLAVDHRIEAGFERLATRHAARALVVVLVLHAEEDGFHVEFDVIDRADSHG